MLHIITQYKKLFTTFMFNNLDTFNGEASFKDTLKNALDDKVLSLDEAQELLTRLENGEQLKYSKNSANTLVNDFGVAGTETWLNKKSFKEKLKSIVVNTKQERVTTMSDTTKKVQEVSKGVESVIMTSIDKLEGIVLKKGDKGPKVKILQQILTKLGYRLGNTNGVFGSNTKKALQDFQLNNDLKDDGVFGNKTFIELKAEANNSYEDRYQHFDAQIAKDSVKIAIERTKKYKKNIQENNEKVAELTNKLEKVSIINRALESYLNKAEVKDWLKDSGSDLASIFQSDYFMNYLLKEDPSLDKLSDNEKERLSKNIERDLPVLLESMQKEKFEKNKIISNIKEGAIYYTVIGVPLATANITDNQYIKASASMSDAANFYDSITNNFVYIPSGKKDIEADFNALNSANQNQIEKVERSYLKNIDFGKKENVTGAMFSWFEKNMPNWFNGDIKADKAQEKISEYNKLVNTPNFDINKAKKLIKDLNKILGEQYKEEVDEQNAIHKRPSFIKYLKINDIETITVEDDFGNTNTELVSSMSLKELSKVYPKLYANFNVQYNNSNNKYINPENKAQKRVEDANNVLKQANINWSNIEKFKDQIIDSGNDMTVFNTVNETNLSSAIKLAAIAEVFDIKKLGIDNLLKAHPVISKSLENKLKSIDFTSAGSINKYSTDPEIKTYLKVIENPKEYNKYFNSELLKLNKGIKQFDKVRHNRFGASLLSYNNDTKAWAEALATHGNTKNGISTLANISLQLSKTMGLEVTPAELQEYIGKGKKTTRNGSEYVINFSNTGSSKTQKAENLSTQEYVGFTVEKTYEVFIKDGKKLRINEKIPLSLKENCANLNLDSQNAKYTVDEIDKKGTLIESMSLDEALSRVETGKFVIPIVGLSMLGGILRHTGSATDGTTSGNPHSMPGIETGTTGNLSNIGITPNI